MIGYFEICELIKSYGWTRIWDKNKRVPILYKGNDWIGYEDSQSLIEKVDLFKIFLNILILYAIGKVC